MRRRIRLNETDLRRMIVREIKRCVVNEGGHLYGHDDDGNVFTNSKDTWRGVPGTTFVWHGEWSDPEVFYDGEELNGSELEDYMWAEYTYECEDEGKKPTEQEYDNLPSDWFAEKLDDFVNAMYQE